jgi:hypothetical protein
MIEIATRAKKANRCHSGGLNRCGAALRFSLASRISTTNELSVVLSVVLRRVRLPVIRTYNRPVAGSFFGPKVANGQPWAYVGSYVYEEKSVF